MDREIANHLAHAVLRLAPADHGDIGGGAADIQAQGIPHIRHAGHLAGPDHARGSARQQHLGALCLACLRRHDAAIGFGDHGFGPDTRLHQRGLQRA